MDSINLESTNNRQDLSDFTNNPIDLQDLPQFDQVPLHGIQPHYWKVVRFNLIVLAILLIIINVVVYAMAEEPTVLAITVPVSAALVILLTALYKRAIGKMGYAFRERDVIFRHGVITITTTVIPYHRVQHVAMHEGWLSRTLGLARIQVYTAGSGSGDISIPGLEASDAVQLKQLLMGKIAEES